MIIFWEVLIGKDNQVTSRYIFYRSKVVFDTIVDVGLIPNLALVKFFSLELPLIAPVITRQALY